MSTARIPNSLRPSRRPVTRSRYVVWGILLMVLKYAFEANVIAELSNGFYSPLDFLNPLYSPRRFLLDGGPGWFGLAWMAWTIPFVAFAVLWSVYRAIDAGWSPWLGLIIFVPFVNFLLMATLACVPSTADRRATSSWLEGEPPHDAPDASTKFSSAAAAAGAGIGVSFLYAVVVSLFCIYAIGDYGASLFFGIPFLAGAVAGYAFNRDQRRGEGATLFVTSLPMLLTGTFFLLRTSRAPSV